MPLKMQDIANLAGVSKATVSKVCNNSPEISDETVAHVRRIMEEHNFQPQTRQKRKVSSSTRNIAFIIDIPSRYLFGNPFLCECLVGVGEVLSSHGYSISFYLQKDIDYAELYKKKAIVGALFMVPAYYNPYIKMLYDAGCPLVSIGEHYMKDSIRYIDSDDATGVYSCVQYLYDLNHRRIAFLGGNPGVGSGINRLAGYRRALEDLGIPFDESIVLRSTYNLQDDGEIMMDKLLDREDTPTAIICFNDMVAAGALRAIKRHGFRVPEDFSIIGFDDQSICELLEPRLTSVHNIATRKGRDAAQWLIDAIENSPDKTASKSILLPTNLVIRDSTKRR